MSIKNDIKELVECFGIPGYEEDVRRLLRTKLEPFVDEISVDGLGNLIAKRQGSRETPVLMFAAHMDEVGFLVKYIDDRGFVRISTGVGIHDPRVILSQEVLIHTENGKVRGIVGTRPVHLLSKDEYAKPIDVRDMFVDVGARSKKEVEEWGIRVGDPITYASGFRELKNPDIILARALDNRAGCAVMIETIRRLSTEGHAATVYAVGTVQEEVGMRGASAASFTVKPDVAIVLDMFPAGDTPGFEPYDMPASVGSGVGIEILDYWREIPFSGVVASRKLVRFLEMIAKEENIPCQPLILEGGGTTDACAIQMSRQGIPVGVIATVGRYTHTQYLLASMTELELATNLAVAAAKKIHELKWP